MRVRHGIEGALSRLADFMNVVNPGLSKEQWEQWRLAEETKFEMKLPKEDVGMPLPLEISVEEARVIHGELHQVLWAMCTGPYHLPEELGQDLKKRLQISTSTLIGVILSRLETVQFKWMCRRVDCGGVVIRRGGENERWVVEPIPIGIDARTTLYYVLVEALRLGAIATLKICPSAACRKYFVTEDPRQHFCNHHCRFAFNNHQRKARKDKLKETRRTKRENVLQKARRLRDEGKSPRVVKAETGLSEGVIEKIFEEQY